MNTYITLKQIIMGSRHIPTGKTRHTDGQKELPHPVILKIVKYENDPGIYLLRLDSVGKEITDTLHETVEDATAQAKWEYQILPQEWKTITMVNQE